MRSRPNDDELTRIARLEEKVRRLQNQAFGGGGGGGGVDLSWSSFTWLDTSQVDGSGPRDECKFAVLDDLLLVTGIVFINSTYTDASEQATAPIDLTAFGADNTNHVLDSGFAVNYMVGTGDIRPGWMRLRLKGTGFPVVYDFTKLFVSFSCNGGTPGIGANVYASGSIRLQPTT